MTPAYAPPPPIVPPLPEPDQTSSPNPADHNDTRMSFGFHYGQVEMITCTCRVCAATAGQGSGKTSGAYWWLYGRMQLHPGESWLIGFPDYGLLTRVILNQPDPDRLTLVQFLAALGEDPVLHIQERRITCKSGTIFFASGHDLVGWEGAHVKGAWLDEFDEMPLQAFRRAMERTRMRDGQVLLTGTPRNVAWIKTEMEQNPGLIHRVQFPSTANPKYPLHALEEARAILPWWEFQRLYLGILADRDSGNMFRRAWWNYYEVEDTPPPMIFTLQAWDTAFKVKTWNDYSAGATWGMTRSGLYLLDMWRDRAEYPSLKQACKDQYDKWSPSIVLMEDKASGQSLIQDIRANTRIPIYPIKADKDKVTRAASVTGVVQSGVCYLPEYAPWLKTFLDEHEEFPDGTFDDQVDTTSMALNYLKNLRGGLSNGMEMGEGKTARDSNAWSGNAEYSQGELVGAGSGYGGDSNSRAWNS